MLELELFYPEASVAWDRDVAHQEWAPVFRMRGSVIIGRWDLWADDVACGDRVRRLTQRACRCVRWDGDHWEPRSPRGYRIVDRRTLMTVLLEDRCGTAELQ